MFQGNGDEGGLEEIRSSDLITTVLLQKPFRSNFNIFKPLTAAHCVVNLTVPSNIKNKRKCKEKELSDVNQHVPPLNFHATSISNISGSLLSNEKESDRSETGNVEDATYVDVKTNDEEIGSILPAPIPTAAPEEHTNEKTPTVVHMSHKYSDLQEVPDDDLLQLEKTLEDNMRPQVAEISGSTAVMEENDYIDESTDEPIAGKLPLIEDDRIARPHSSTSGVKEKLDLNVIESHRNSLQAHLEQFIAKVEEDLNGCYLGFSDGSASEPTVRSQISDLTAADLGVQTQDDLDMQCGITSEGSNQEVGKNLETSYTLIEHLATENKALQEERYELQEALLVREGEADNLHKRIDSIQTEMRLILRENSNLHDRIKDEGWQVDYQKTFDDNNRKQELEKQAEDMIYQVNKLREELSQLQTERKDLLITRQLAKATIMEKYLEKHIADIGDNKDSKISQTDYASALETIAALRNDNSKLKQQLEELLQRENRFTENEGELKAVKIELSHLRETDIGKQELIEKYLKENKAYQEEIEDLKALMEDQNADVESYRQKYLEAQQRVEELSRDLDLKQVQLQTVKDDCAAELLRVRSQCQEKLSHLQHLPDVLKNTQMQLEESTKVRVIAEKSLEEAKAELQQLVESRKILERTLEMERRSRSINPAERAKLLTQMSRLEEQQNIVKNENSCLLTRLARSEEAAQQWERRLDEKVSELAQMSKYLEDTKAESAKQLFRSKERADTIRRSMQLQIAQLEREVAAARASVKRAEKDKDEIQKKAQSQVISLTEALEEGQTKWRSLQAHIESLQNSIQSANLPLKYQILSDVDTNVEQRDKFTYRYPTEIELKRF